MYDKATAKIITTAVSCCASGVCKGCPYVPFPNCEEMLSRDIENFLDINTRPLKVDELEHHQVVWLEVAGMTSTYPALTDGIRDEFAYFIAPHGIHARGALYQYGSMWRAWKYKPDEEDRKCAPWEMIP